MAVSPALVVEPFPRRDPLGERGHLGLMLLNGNVVETGAPSIIAASHTSDSIPSR